MRSVDESSEVQNFIINKINNNKNGTNKHWQRGWYGLITEIAAKHSDGTLISHEWLKQKFGIEETKLEEFDSVDEFLEAIKIRQFAYMSLVDKLRWQLLEKEKMYIRNIVGKGYQIINPKDQTVFGYDEMVRLIKKAVWQADAIINNVRPVPSEQQSKDNDLRAKFGLLKGLMSGIKREKWGNDREEEITEEIE